MNPKDLEKLLNDLHNQKLDPKQVMKKLETLPFENLDFAKVDHHQLILIELLSAFLIILPISRVALFIIESCISPLGF